MKNSIEHLLENIEVTTTNTKVPKLTFVHNRIAIKYPYDYPSDDKIKVENMANLVAQQLYPIKNAWRGKIRPLIHEEGWNFNSIVLQNSAQTATKKIIV